VGRERSCLAFGVRGNGGGYPSEVRHEAAGNFEKARQALDGSKAPLAAGVSPSEILLRCCVEDLPFTTLGRIIGTDGDIAKARVAQLLAVLTVHYQSVDRDRGRDSTPNTEAGAIRLFDPDISERRIPPST
jgi:hypothetical protein